jgi:prolyl-tRNA synthetase
MRGREFLMKDAYSFDLDEEGLKASYEAMFVAYLRTFARLGLQAVPVKARLGRSAAISAMNSTSSPKPAKAQSSTMRRSRTSPATSCSAPTARRSRG